MKKYIIVQRIGRLGRIKMSAQNKSFAFTEKDTGKASNDKSLLVGIDLGTTTSSMGIMRGHGDTMVPEIVHMESGRTVIPSCVMYHKGEFVVGEEAYKQRYKPNVIYSVKSIMGTNKKVELSWGGKTHEFTPAEISAEILKEMVRQAEKKYGQGTIKNVTITVPAYFDSAQREATMEAGRLAGLNVVSLINEPTAASLAYSMGEDVKTQHVLVYDFGGGTFDVSLVRISKPQEDVSFSLLKLSDEKAEDKIIVEVVDVDGDNKLGGDDIDRALFSELAKSINAVMKQHGVKIDFEKDCSREYREELILRLENYKKRGFEDHSFEMNIRTNLNDSKGTRVDISVTLTKETFKRALAPVYNKTKTITSNLIKKHEDIEITKIVLVGGSTENKTLREQLQRDFKNIPVFAELKAFEAVALGAAVNTGIRLGKSKASLFDVIAIPIGFKMFDGKFRRMIGKGELLPVKVTDVCTTVEDNQESIRLEVYQGFSSEAVENKFLGELVIDNIPKGKAQEIQIKISLQVDITGVLTCFVQIGGVQVEKRLQNILVVEDENKKLGKYNKKLLRWKRILGDKAEKSPVSELFSQAAEGDEIAVQKLSSLVKEIGKDYRKEEIAEEIRTMQEQVGSTDYASEE